MIQWKITLMSMFIDIYEDNKGEIVLEEPQSWNSRDVIKMSKIKSIYC